MSCYRELHERYLNFLSDHLAPLDGVARMPERDVDDHVSQDLRAGARELMTILSASKLSREAVPAGADLSYLKAARRLRTREETIASRLHRGPRYLRPLIRDAVATGAES